jgi:protein-tyrosine phosphatase
MDASKPIPYATRTRLVTLAGASNFRDLGGYPTTDGRRTRWGRLYRSDALHLLTPADVITLRGLGLRTVIDLRAAAEAARLGRGLLGGEPIRYRNVPMSGEAPGLAEGPLPEPSRDPSPEPSRDPSPSPDSDPDPVERYLAYLDVAGPAIVAVVEEIVTEDRLPLVFHCFFGKDRSGVLTALLLSWLGVERSVIAEDFARSTEPMSRLLARLAEDPVYAETIGQTPPQLLRSDGEDMVSFLTALDVRHGGPLAWFLSVGGRNEQIERVTELLLEGPGQGDQREDPSPTG